eukprot:gene4922-8510_t
MSAYQNYLKHDFDSDEKWKQYLSNLFIPCDLPENKQNEIIKKYQYKFYSANIEELPEPIPPCPLSLITIEARETQTATLIFLHGLGDNGKGWSSHFKTYLHKQYPFLKMIFPNADSQPVSINGGMKMPSWYDIKGLSINDEEDETGIRKSASIVHNLIAEEVRAGISSDRIIIGGFSQGGAIAFFSGLTCKHKLCGILTLSTYIPLKEKIIKELSDSNKETKILQCHGKVDPVVQFTWGYLSYQMISQIRGEENIEFITYDGLGHSSSQQELIDIEKWIGKRFK